MTETEVAQKENSIILKPYKRQYVIDEPAERIVNLMWKLGLQCSNVRAETDTYGWGGQFYTRIRNIESFGLGRPPELDFHMWFCRIQGLAPGSGKFNDTSGLHTIQIPGKALDVYEDFSGPTLNVYVGEGGWPAIGYAPDTKWYPTNQKLNGLPRTSVEYGGSADPVFGRYTSGLQPYLVSDNDSREYHPVGTDPKFYRTAEVLQEFKDYMEKIIIPHLERELELKTKRYQNLERG